jgi:hypothetical protein
MYTLKQLAVQKGDPLCLTTWQLWRPKDPLEAGKRGWSRAKKKVVIGDGAQWIWHLVAEHFPGPSDCYSKTRVRTEL